MPLNDEEYQYLLYLKREWKKNTPRFSEKQLLEIFSEVKGIIPEKITEWEEERDKLKTKIKKKLKRIKSFDTDEFSKWFHKEIIRMYHGDELLEIENHISRLKRLLSTSSGEISKDFITEDQKQRALTVPIENLYKRQLRGTGRTLVGLCPFHNEKTPSFHIYPETNSCWCFGCNQGGDVINFLQLACGFSFKEAVKYLSF